MKDLEGSITICLKNNRAYLGFASSVSTDALASQCPQPFLADYLPVFLAACEDLVATSPKTFVEDLLEGSESILKHG